MRPTINFTFNSHLTMPLWDHKVRQDPKKKKMKLEDITMETLKDNKP